jgi:hypothetical protein
MKMRGIARVVLFTFPPHHHRRSSWQGRGNGKAEDVACVTTSSFRVWSTLSDLSPPNRRGKHHHPATTCTAFSPHCAEDRHGPRRSQHETESPKQSDCTLPPDDCERRLSGSSNVRMYLQNVSNRICPCSTSHLGWISLFAFLFFSLPRARCALLPLSRCEMTTSLGLVSLKSPRL